MYDLISIGDSTIDVFMEVDPSDTEALCSLDDEKCLIAFGYGAKIPVKKLTRISAVGNAANNAIGSTRLGLNTALYTVLGSDQDAQEMKKVFEDEGIDASQVVMESGKASNFSVVLNYGAERTIFVYHEERAYDISNLPQTRWAYFTSVAKNHQILHKQIPEYVKKYNVKLGYNPGSHELKEGIEALKSILGVTEVFIVNLEEAIGLVGGDQNNVKDLIKRLKEFGPKIVVITDARNGSYASLDGREIWHAGIPEESPVVERTGCGDAYSTGFLVALIQGKDLPEAMVWGTMNATSVIQFIGAREGLLRPEGMKEFIKKYKGSFKVEMY